MNGAPGALELGDVLGTTVRTLRAQALPIASGCALAILPFTAIDLVFESEHRAPPAVLNILSAIVSCWLYALIAQLALGAIDDAEVSFAAAARAARSTVGTVFGISVLQSIGIGLGLVALIVPGVVFWTWSYLAIPVYLFEGAHGVAGFRRSGELTRGHRGTIFAVGIVTFGVLAVAFLVLTSPMIVALLSGDPEPERVLDAPVLGYGLVLGLSLLQAAYAAFSTVAMTVVYARLRDRHADVDGAAIAEVFE